MTEEPRDGTLDSFVAAWAAPPPGSQFHSRVRRAFDLEFGEIPWWRGWNGAFAWRAGTTLCGGAALGAFLLVMIGLAFPQSARFRLPWLNPSFTMDIEEVQYSEDGTPPVHTFRRTVPAGGTHDVILWRYSPDHPYDTILPRIVSQANYLLYRIASPLFENTEQTKVRANALAAYVKAGCIRGDKIASGEETVLGEEKLLGYSTIIVQTRTKDYQGKETHWMAPGLGCRVLKFTVEGQRPDGTYRMRYEGRAVDIVP